MPPASIDGDFDRNLKAAFARAALANPSLMSGVRSADEAAHRALRIASRMMKEFRGVQLPEVRQLSDDEMLRWEADIERHRQGSRIGESQRNRDTLPAIPSRLRADLSPPVLPRRKTARQRFASVTDITLTPGFYRHVHGRDDGNVGDGKT